MIRYKKYKLLKDLPDGSVVGDEYECGKQFNFYFNTRIHKEATAVDEGHRWDTWQVENNPKFFELIKEEPKEVFTWNDKLAVEYCNVFKYSTPSNLQEFKDRIISDQSKTSFMPDVSTRIKHWTEPLATESKPDTSKEKIEVYVSGDGMFGQMVSVRPKSPSWSIPKEKLPAIKQAIESVLNNEKLYTKFDVDILIEDAFNAAREKPTPHFNAPQFFYPDFESYLNHISKTTKE